MHFIQNELYNIHCMRKITHIFISNENEKLSYSEEENSMYHVFVAALQMDEVLPKYKSHPHSHIYFFKNDNLR